MATSSAVFHSPDTELFLIHAESARALAARVEAASSRLASTAEAPSLPALAAEWLAAVDPRAGSRAALVAGTPLELRQRLDQLALLLSAAPPEGERPRVHKDPTQHVFVSHRPVDPAPRVAFLFPGQGCQRLNMGRTLIERFPWARQMLTQAEQVLAAVGAPPVGPRLLRPFDAAVPEADRARWFAELSDVEVAGPAIILTGALWCRYLEILGVHPAVVGGHSQGEQMAFHAAGAVDFAGVIQLSAFMGRAGSPRYNPGTAGGMAVLSCSAEVARALVAAAPGQAAVANVNAPAQVVVAADPQALAWVLAAAVERGIEVRPLPVSHAFHSTLVADGGIYMRANGPRLPPVPPAGQLKARLYSCVAARPVGEGTAPLDHFSDMVTRPVDFEATVRAMAREVDLFLEPGAGRALSGLVAAIDPALTCLPLEPIPGRTRALHAALAALFAWGCPVRWDIVGKGLAPR